MDRLPDRKADSWPYSLQLPRPRCCPLATFGQVRNASYDSGNSPGNQGPRQALYNAPADGGTTAPASRYVDANGNQMVVPAGYCEQCGQGCDCYGGEWLRRLAAVNVADAAGMAVYPGCQGGYPGCCPMGAGGTDPPIGYDLMNDTGIEGDLVDQRGPHYFDIRAEAVFLQRDKSFEQNIDFTSLNVGNDVAPVVLSAASWISKTHNAASASWADTTSARCRSSNLATWAFSTGTTVRRSRPDQNNLFSLFSRPAPEPGLFGTEPGRRDMTRRWTKSVHRTCVARTASSFRPICNRPKSATAAIGSVTSRAFPERCWPASATRS